MGRKFTEQQLRRENLAYAGTGGVSAVSCRAAFRPAFRDDATGRIELARFETGEPAPMHIFLGLPVDWITERDPEGHAIALLGSVVAGFVRNAEFYTREEVALLI